MQSQRRGARAPSPGRTPTLLAMVLLGVLVGACGLRTPRYNVLLVTLDTTRADHLGCYGYPLDTSPHIDALAAEGVLFTRAISTSSLTPISHASIFTGLDPDGHGLRVMFGGSGDYLPPDRITLATLLAEAGWRTGAFVSAVPASEHYGLERGFQTFSSGRAAQVDMGAPVEPGSVTLWNDLSEVGAQRRADATTREALTWLEGTEQPFFLWVHYFDPHDPVLVPGEEVLRRFDARPERPDGELALYDAEISFMDQHLGELVRALEEAGTYDETVILVMSDHGQGLGDHGWFQHRLLYQEHVRAVLIARVPGEPGGRVIDDLVRNTDVAPTLLELFGLETEADMDGRSLLPLLEGKDETPRIALSESLNGPKVRRRGTVRDLPPRQRDLLFSVIEGDWKLIHHHRKPRNSELYDLARDPGELDNVIADHPEIVDRLRTWLRSSGALELQLEESRRPTDDETLRQLEALGYVQ